MKISRILPVAALAVFFGHAACASQRDVAYGPDPSQQLDICTPQGAHPPAPAVLMIHGGGWKTGSRDREAKVCEGLARNGIVAIPTDYRLATGAAGTIWPAQLEDVQLAMRWVRSHAAEFGIDPGHICAQGDSAGGQLALLLGVLPGIEPGDMQSRLPGISPQAQCVVSVSGPADLSGASTVRPETVANLLGGGNAAAVAAQERSASPALRVQRGAAPTLLIHGKSDRTVPFAQAEEMQAALTRAGGQAWLVSYDGTHVLKGLTQDQRGAVWEMIGAFVRTPRLAGPPRPLSLEEALGQSR